MTPTMKQSAIQRAVQKANGQTALADLIGVTQGLVWQWLNGAQINTRHFAAIERETGVKATDLLADEMKKAAERAKQAKHKTS